MSVDDAELFMLTVGTNDVLFFSERDRAAIHRVAREQGVEDIVEIFEDTTTPSIASHVVAMYDLVCSILLLDIEEQRARTDRGRFVAPGSAGSFGGTVFRYCEELLLTAAAPSSKSA